MTFQSAPAVEKVKGLPSLPAVEVQPLLRQVYMWMTLAMLVTTGSALVISSLGPEALSPPLVLGAVIAQLALVMALSWGLQRMSVGLAQVLFFVYAATVGVTISLVLLVYDGSTVIAAFATTAVLFLVMTMMGLTTRFDLTRYSSYFFFALIGLLVAMVINLFLNSSGLELLISFLGVVIFTALTAYDTQRIKRLAADPRLAGEGTVTMTRLSIMGALGLYLNFLNLFLFLLRLFAGARD